MRLYKCDVCGKILSADSVFNNKAESSRNFYEFDICKECLEKVLKRREQYKKEYERIEF